MQGRVVSLSTSRPLPPNGVRICVRRSAEQTASSPMSRPPTADLFRQRDLAQQLPSSSPARSNASSATRSASGRDYDGRGMDHMLTLADGQHHLATATATGAAAGRRRADPFQRSSAAQTGKTVASNSPLFYYDLYLDGKNTQINWAKLKTQNVGRNSQKISRPRSIQKFLEREGQYSNGHHKTSCVLPLAFDLSAGRYDTKSSRISWTRSRMTRTDTSAPA